MQLRPLSASALRPVDLAVWALLALSVSVRSGYSIGAFMLLLVGLWRWPALLRGELAVPRAMAQWAAAIVLMALAWTMHIVEDGQLITSTLGLDRVSKYWMVLLLLPALLARVPATWALFWGCVLGAIGAGLTALWQTAGLDWPRAQGYTNAIQFGNLALLLGLWCSIWALHVPQRAWRALAWLGAAMGLLASVASGTRGGWVVLPLCLLLVLYLGLPRAGGSRWAPLARALGFTLMLCLPLVFISPVHERIQLAVSELAASAIEGEGTSIGLRLAEWRFAWRQGAAHPWWGVGQKGYETAQQAAVASGEAPAEMVMLNHAHNEWLDLFAKRGLPGVIALLVFFGLPAWWFWQALKRRDRAAPVPSAQRAAALCGLVTVLGFAGFGATQVMFAHNNGNLMYLLSVSIWLAASGMGLRHNRGAD
ncbi:O-antigen ligase family protein [Comamonas flocculans]|uniref:O-antigen ligase family protein n=1 Tax=Comamonas flocculans TaxID=2597701 RepID=A0A5B8RTY3_9BURK|nr:O-antigen ligase family protein [Comamonas flocculans]QEA12971.1 O-antigen ligase family protein [Comamonas flocculans]